MSNAVRPLAFLAALALVACTVPRADSPTHTDTPADSPTHTDTPADSPTHTDTPADSPTHTVPRADSPTHTDTPARGLRKLRRFKAAEARQAVAVDAHHFYAIDNREIGKYDKRTGERVGGYEDPEGGGIRHLNSGIVFDGRLYCANSNYPGVPMLSSIEIFDTETLAHVESHSFGMLPGSATWIDRRDGVWWVGFGNYEGRGGITGRGTAWTEIALYDEKWRRVGGYGFPAEAIERFGTRSNSGTTFGPDGLLYATGHDEAELYVLRIPRAGAALEFVEALSVTAEGQGIAWDPSDPRVLYTILRRTREVVVSRLPDRSD